MKSHFSVGSRAAIACAVSSAAVMIPQICSASIAADYATDPAYASGWSSGANGGYGFTPWALGGTAWTMNTGAPDNQLGRAWTLYDPTSGNLATATRGFAPLQVGQTISTVFDNPTYLGYWKGWTVGLLSSGVERVSAWQFRIGWTTPTPPYAGGNAEGLWQAGDGHLTSLHASDTDAGVRLDIALTSMNTYQLTMTPLDNPGLAYTESGTLANSGNIDQIQFTYYPTPELDWNWNPVANEAFYISSIQIIPEPSALALLGLGGLLFLRRRK